MTPNEAERVHTARRQLAALARDNDWTPTLPHSGWHPHHNYHWVWLHLFRQTTGSDSARIAIEWCDNPDIAPTGCNMHVTIDGRESVTHVRTRRLLERAISNPAWLHAAHALACCDPEPIIDLREAV